MQTPVHEYVRCLAEGSYTTEKEGAARRVLRTSVYARLVLSLAPCRGACVCVMPEHGGQLACLVVEP